MAYDIIAIPGLDNACVPPFLAALKKRDSFVDYNTLMCYIYLAAFVIVSVRETTMPSVERVAAMVVPDGTTHLTFT